VRTYKNTKDIKSRTGRGPVKFNFYERLDELLGDSPSNASPHSIDVDELQSQNTEVECGTLTPNSDSSLDTPSSISSCEKKRKNPSIELVKVKTKFFEDKIKNMIEKEANRKQWIDENLKHKKQKLDLYKKKRDRREKSSHIRRVRKNIKRKNT